VGFVSASHDFTVKVWALSGEIVSELLGHTAVVYACAALPSGLIASGGVCVLRFFVYIISLYDLVDNALVHSPAPWPHCVKWGDRILVFLFTFQPVRLNG